MRPDWDITSPELKAAWQQGRKELFYPAGKTYAQALAYAVVGLTLCETVRSHSIE